MRNMYAYCSLPLLSLNVFKHSSIGTFAWGFETIKGRKPPVSLLVGTCSKRSWGFAMCFFSAMLGRALVAVCVHVNSRFSVPPAVSHTCSAPGLRRFTTPVYSSRLVSAFSSKLSMTSTTPLQLASMASTSGSLGPTASELAAAFSRRRCAR
jgi:hypothetical protein